MNRKESKRYRLSITVLWQASTLFRNDSVTPQSKSSALVLRVTGFIVHLMSVSCLILQRIAKWSLWLSDKAVVSHHVLQNIVLRFQFSVRKTFKTVQNAHSSFRRSLLADHTMFAFARLYRFTHVCCEEAGVLVSDL